MTPSSSRRITLDGWAVLLGLAAALIVRIGLVRTIPW
jgi:hypothetical protein